MEGLKRENGCMMLGHVEQVHTGTVLPPARTNGFYWVMVGNEWEVARLADGYWYITESDCYWRQDSADIVAGPKLTPPD